MQSSCCLVNTNEVFTLNLDVSPSGPSGEVQMASNPKTGITVVHDLESRVRSVSILNVLGTEVFNFHNPREANFTIDLSTQPSGVYFMKIVTDDTIIERKIVKD